MQLDVKELEALMTQAKKDGFNRFMGQPMTRAMLAILPPSEHLEVILQACYDQGFDTGCVNNTIEMLKYLTKKAPR
jgi:hypothetical protein